MATKDPFPALQATLHRDPEVSEMKAFGSLGFRVRGKVFAIFWKGDLVLKLPQERAQALLASNLAKAWDPGHGRTMKEWVAFAPRTSGQWVRLVGEARTFVAAGASVRKNPARRTRSK